MSLNISTSSRHDNLREDIHLLKVLSSLNTCTDSSFEFAQACKIIISKLKEMNLIIREYSSAVHCKQSLLVAESKEQNPFVEVTLVCHLDTVLPPREIVYHQDEISGSGVADNKGGIVCALRFLEYIRDLPNVKVRFVCSPSEETGSLGFHSLFQSWGKTSDLVFGFEPAQEGSLIEKRNGNRWYQVQVQGVSSHAGRMNDACVNAAHEACHKISSLSSLNNISDFVRLNIGHLEGGDGLFNRTCERVSFKLDTRFPSHEIREQLHRKLELIFARKTELCHVTGKEAFCFYSIEDDCPPMDSNIKYSFLTQKIQQAIASIEGGNVGLVHSGGAADINYFSNTQNYCLDGLGPVGSGIHTRDEKIRASSLESRPFALANFFHEWINERYLEGAGHESTVTQLKSLEL